MKKNKLIMCLSATLLIASCTQTIDPSNSDISSSNSDLNSSSNSMVSSDVSTSNSSADLTSSSPESSTSVSSVDSASQSTSVATPKMTIVTSVSMPETFIEFRSHAKGENDNERSRFMELNKDYLVGDDNVFSCKPDLTFMEVDPVTLESNEIDIENWNFDITLFENKGNDVFEELAKTNEYIENVDYSTCAIDFSDKAIGKSFKIKVIPDGLTDKQKEDINTWSMDLLVSVIDGYNVYDAKEFAYVNNSVDVLSKKTSINDIKENEIWNEFKTTHGLQLDFYPENLILQKDIKITNEDIPTGYFFSDDEISKSDIDYEKALGSLKDWNGIYSRRFNDNDQFNIYGNYFSLDASEISLVVRDGTQPVANGGTVISHAALFWFTGSDKASASFNDLNLLGNSPRQENETLSGGLIFNKVTGPEFTATNNNAVCWFITYFDNHSQAQYLIEKCRAYDNFNSFIYSWGGNNVIVKDSEMIGAGGPVIIQDHGSHDASGNGGYIPHTQFINSRLESYVSGNEGWFNIVGASALVPQVKQMDKIFNTVGRSFLKANSDQSNTFFNLICVNKSGDAETVTSKKIQGSISIDDYAFNYGKDNPMVGGLCNNEQLFKAGAPIYETSAGGSSYFNGTNLMNALNQPIASPDDAMFSGDYLCIYSMGMAFVVGYGPMGQTYSK